MSFTQKIKKIDWMFLGIVFINVILATYFFSLKTDFHLDEFFSFIHSNSTQGAYLQQTIKAFEENSNEHIYTPDAWKDMLITQESNTFKYAHIFKNLSYSVHPPLYYLIFHTVSSFFPNVFSKWLEYPINITCLILALFMLYKLACKVFKDKYIVYTTIILYGFSLVTLNIFMFIRSYMLQMFLGTFIIYQHLQLFETEKKACTFLIKIFIASCFIFLTHYYALIFMFFISAITCLHFFFQQKYKTLFLYIFTVSASLALSFVFFPEAFNVLQHSPRAIQTQTHLSIFEFLNFNYINKIFQLILIEIFTFNAYSLQHVFLFVFILFILLFFYLKKQDSNSFKINKNIKIIVLFVLFYMVFVSYISPDVEGKDDRYYAPIIPSLILVLVYVLYAILSLMRLNKNSISFLLLIFAILNSILTNFPTRTIYPFIISNKTEDILQNLRDKRILLIGEDYQSYNFIADLTNIQEVSFYKKLDKEILLSSDADFLIIFNSLTRDNRVEDTPIKSLPENVMPYIKFKETIKKGLGFYDIYFIKKF